MKEASGELSMTAIAVVAIAAVGIVFTTLVWPSMKNGIERSTNCAQAFNCVCTDKCICSYTDKTGAVVNSYECPKNKVDVAPN